MTNETTTPKEVITNAHLQSIKKVELRINDITYEIRKLPWRHFDSYFKDFKGFITEILPDNLLELLTGGNTSSQDFKLDLDVMKMVKDFPTELIANMVAHCVYIKGASPDEPYIKVEVDDLDYDDVFALAGKSVLLNFVDASGVKAFFIDLGTMFPSMASNLVLEDNSQASTPMSKGSKKKDKKQRNKN